MTTPQNPHNDLQHLRDRYAREAGAGAGVPRPAVPSQPPQVNNPVPPRRVEQPALNYRDQVDPFAGMSDEDVVFETGGPGVPDEWSRNAQPAPERHEPQFAPPSEGQPMFRDEQPTSSAHWSDKMNDDDDYRVRSKRDRPQHGWRRFAAETLRLPVSKSKAEMEYDRLIAMTNRSLLGPKVIGVMGGKGGVGKTTTALSIASTIAETRSKPVVAITLDYNSTLALRTKSVSEPARGNVSILEFATDTTIRTPNDIAGCMRNNKHRLSVLGTGLNPVRHDQLNGEQFSHALRVLKSQYEIIVIDFGNTPNSSAYWEALRSLDALILVTSTENDSMQGTRTIEEIARESGLTDLMDERTLMVVNHRTSAEPKVDIEHFVARQQAVSRREVIFFPWDDHLSESGPIDLDLVSKSNRFQIIKAAAIIMTRLPA